MARAAETIRIGISSCLRGLVPLIVPITLIKHHVCVHDVEYLAGQVCLDPHPRN